MVAESFSLGFAVAVVATAACFATALAGRLSGRVARVLAALIGSAAVAGWVALAANQELATAVAAAGLTICAIAVVAASMLSRLIERTRRLDTESARVEQRLRALIEQEGTERAAELERTLARARAESASRLAEEERRIAEERRRTAVAS